MLPRNSKCPYLFNLIKIRTSICSPVSIRCVTCVIRHRDIFLIRLKSFWTDREKHLRCVQQSRHLWVLTKFTWKTNFGKWLWAIVLQASHLVFLFDYLMPNSLWHHPRNSSLRLLFRVVIFKEKPTLKVCYKVYNTYQVPKGNKI